MNRRTFLRSACGAAAGVLIPTRSASPALCSAPRGHKVIIVVFGGGTRYSESIGDPEHRYLPRLWNEMVPQGTLFTDVRVEGRVVHTNCTASILTGYREYDGDNDWSRPVEHPTVFEVFRKARGAPDTAAWAFVYASILSSVGQSRASGFGPPFAANVVEPPTIPRETADRLGTMLQNAAGTGLVQEQLEAARVGASAVRRESRINFSGLQSDLARHFMSERYQAWKSCSGTTSHDAFLTGCAIDCMKRFAPDMITLAFGEIDSAHYGSWSRYVEAIRRTDELTYRIWRAAEALEAYRGNTVMLITPDHGRELESPTGLGYVHHSNFYTRENEDEGCRRVWMLLLGPGIGKEHRVNSQVAQTAVAATALEYLRIDASPGAAPSLLSMTR